MSRLITLSGVLVALLVPLAGYATQHHELEVSVETGVRQIHVVDAIKLPVSGDNYEFLLNQSFTIDRVEGGKVTASDAVLRYKDIPPGITLYRLEAEQQTVTLHYHADINQLVKDKAGVVLAYPEGERTADGVFLDPGAAWYPIVASSDDVVSFNMQVSMPEQWAAISQGALHSDVTEGGRKRMVWQELQPQQGIFLIVGRYVAYAETTHGHQSQVFLRQSDDALANDYLGLTRDYIALYETLIGHYPYSKFALVESFWESGFGMPSFTFIGPTVIRLPFIRTTSYPHEILHNWWGNSVYVDYSSGNWSEGLTSYLADYLFDEQKGNGANHRREVLQKYTDFVRSDNDFALAQFTSSHEAQGQAVGYGKGQMLFHMLRLKLGNEKFVEALRLFYQQYRFKSANYVDIERVFSQVYGQSLTSFFKQWVWRTGAPELAVAEVVRKQHGAGWRIEGVFKQQQLGAPYQLDVPLAITLEGEATARYFTVNMTEKQQRFAFDIPAKPLRIDVDPEFDLFRRLSIEETPPALSQSFGAERMLLVLAERASPELKQAWRQMAKSWGLEILSDNDLKQLPSDRAVWLLGWENSLLDQVRPSFGDYGVTVTPLRVTLAGQEHQAGNDTLVLVAHNPDHPQHAVVWFAATAPAAIARYGQRLPHYRKYSYLVFDRQHSNIIKGQWPPLSSPLSVALESGAIGTPVLPPRQPLVP